MTEQEQELVRWAAENVMGATEIIERTYIFDILVKDKWYEFEPLANANHWMMVVEAMSNKYNWYCNLDYQGDWMVKFYKSGKRPAQQIDKCVGLAVLNAAKMALGG